MQIIQDLKHIMQTTESMFTRQLCKEDVERLQKLFDLAKSADNEAAFSKDAYMVGWTPGDLHTHELKDVLEPLFASLYAFTKDETNEAKEKAATEQWYVFDTARRKRLMRCT